MYNLGGGTANALSLRELLNKMEEVSGLQAVVDEEAPLPAPVPVNYVSDLTLVKQELDWSPETGLDDGLKTLF
jgi:CDP-paratose 2-epimerase